MILIAFLMFHQKIPTTAVIFLMRLLYDYEI